MAIHLLSKQKTLPIRPKAMRRRLNALMKDLGLSETELSITITDDREIREINAQYRGVDKPTNVLAFALEEGPPMPGAPRVLGDIVISAETIRREAGPLGYTDGEMLYFYLIHGLLHLVGHDHEKGPAEAARQESETERLWNMIRHDL